MDRAGRWERAGVRLLFVVAVGLAGCHLRPAGEPALDRPLARAAPDWKDARDALSRGDRKTALAALAAVMAQSPRFVRAHLLYQDAMLADGREGELLAEYEKRAQRSGLDRALLARIGPHANRMEYLELAQAQEPENPWIQYALGFERLNRSDLEPARRHLEKAAWLDPELPEAHLGLAMLFEKMVRNEDAAEHYESYLESCPLDALRWLKLAMLRHATKDEDGAIAAYRKVVALDPRDLEAAIRRRDVVLTAEQLQRYQEGHPLQYTARVNLSEIFVNRKRYAEARSLLEAALSGNPDLPDAHFNLGIVHERLSLVPVPGASPRVPNSHAEQADHHWSRYLELDGSQQERVRGWLKALRARNPDPFGPPAESGSRAEP